MGKKEPLRIIPLGGLGEIGLNMMIFEYNRKIIVVDCGLMFPADDMLGVDIVIPDFSYLEGREKDILGIILTHGHEDHLGGMPFLLARFKVPVYATRLTIALLENKLAERKITGVRTNVISPDQELTLGDFTLQFVRVSHSIMDGVGLGISTPEGFVVHTGDFKLDFAHSGHQSTDIRKLSRFGDKNVLCMLSDSTNVEQYGYTMSEPEVGKKLRDVFHDAQGRIIITLFASNVARIQQVFNIAAEYGRKVCVSGRSMVSTVAIARKLGYLKAKDKQFLDIRNLGRNSKRRTVILSTGSQGEPMSVLSRIVAERHKHIRIIPGDTVILSSRFIPGNEGTIAALINEMFKKGARVVYETISDIHTSGHAHKEELKLMFKLIRPKYFIPVHGEMRHLVQHCSLAADMGVKRENCLCAKDGDVAEFSGGEGSLTGEMVQTGRVMVDGKGIGDVGNIILTDRKLLSENGIVICTILYSEPGGEIVKGPMVSSKGFVYEPDFEELFEYLKSEAALSFDRIKKEGLLGKIEGRDTLAKDLRRMINKRIHRRPLVVPVMVPVED